MIIKCFTDKSYSGKRISKLFLIILFNLFTLYSYGQETNTYTYGDYDFTEIKTNFPLSMQVRGFVNEVAIAKNKDENYFLIDTLGNPINEEGFRNLDYKNIGNYFVAARNGKFGVINSKGKFVVPNIYKKIILPMWDIDGCTKVFQHGLCMVVDFNDKIGFVDTSGKVIIPLIYTKAFGRSNWIEGSHVIGLNGLLGIIDTLGNIVTPMKYIKLTPMISGHALARDKNNKVLLINRNGVEKKMSYKDFYYIPGREGGVFDGLAGVQNESGLWGYIDTSGNEIVKCQFDWITDFSDGFARVGKGKMSDTSYVKWGYLNTKGVLITPIKYQVADKFEDGLAMVKMGYKKDSLYYHLIDTMGKEINTFKYRDIGSMKYGAARVLNNFWYEEANRDPKGPCRSAILKKGGEEIVIWKEYCIIGLSFSDGLIAIDSNLREGFVDTNGKVIVPCNYHYVYEFNNNYAWVQKEKDGNWYILKKKKR